MGWLGLLIGVLKAGLEIWATKEARKYIERLGELQRLHWDESNKPEGQKSAARIVNIENEIRILAQQAEADMRLAVAR
jgi:hypothetical protein